MKGLKFYRYCHAKQEIDRVFTADLQSSRKSVGEKQKRAMDLVTAAVSSFGICCLIQKKNAKKTGWQNTSSMLIYINRLTRDEVVEKKLKKLLDRSNSTRYDIKVVAQGASKNFLQRFKKCLTKRPLRDILNKLFRTKQRWTKLIKWYKRLNHNNL